VKGRTMKLLNHILTLVSLFGVIGCQFESGERKPFYLDIPIPQINDKVSNFESCDHISGYVTQQLYKKREQEENYYSSIDNVVLADNFITTMDMTAEVAPAPEDGITNIQEEGVDESDMVKVTSQYIVVARTKSLLLLDRQSYQVIDEVELTGDDHNIYVHDESVYVISRLVSDVYALEYSLVYPSPPQPNPQRISVRKFQVSDQGIEMETERVLFGRLVSDRRINNKLLLVKSSALYFDFPNLSVTDGGHIYSTSGKSMAAAGLLYRDGDQIQDLDCNKIYEPVISDFDFRLQSVLVLDLQDLNVTDQLSFVGGGDTVYAHKDAIYIGKQDHFWFTFDSRLEGGRLYDYSTVTKINIDSSTGGLEYKGVGVFPGRAKDSFAFKHYPESEVLAVASTTNDGFPGNSHFFVMKNTQSKNLEIVNGIKYLAKNEDIRATRYFNDYAYIVTFKKTDPLFTIDMKNPENPVLLDALKIPGFSVYLHPLGLDRLIGVGYAGDDRGDFALFQGIQVSLFNTQDPTNVTAIEQREFGERYSTLQLTVDHHAIHVDQASERMALPLTLKSSNTLGFSGAYIINFSNDRVEVEDQLTHIFQIPNLCRMAMDYTNNWWTNAYNAYDINRAFLLDGKWVGVSLFAISDDQGNLVEFPENTYECDKAREGRYYY
jgi:inhibitor of cysteine peptidase